MPYNYRTEFQKYSRYYRSLEPILTKPKGKVYTTIIFSFLAVSLFSWYAIRPTVQTILYLRREISDKTELNKQMEDKIANLIEAQSYYQEIEPILPAVDQALPTIPDAIPLLIQLRNLASSSGTLISVIQLPSVPLTNQTIQSPAGKVTKTVTGTSSEAKQQVFDIALSVRGPYSNIRIFLEGITKMRRIVTIDGLTVLPIRSESVGSASATLENKSLQLALKFKAYYVVN